MVCFGCLRLCLGFVVDVCDLVFGDLALVLVVGFAFGLYKLDLSFLFVCWFRFGFDDAVLFAGDCRFCCYSWLWWNFDLCLICVYFASVFLV